MINLTPIAKPIQERLFEKMRVLGRSKKYIGQPSKADELQLQDMTTRTTFIRMTSGQENPVVMLGGELSDDGKMRAGFKDIYSSRSFRESTATNPVLKERVTPVEMSKASVASSGTAAINNPLQTFEVNVTGGSSIMGRPMPGIKSIDVQFKGGVRALRTANISWTCWSFEDLDRLMPHFLAHGKTVALEWGWVYKKNQFKGLQTLIKNDGKVDEEGFRDNRKTIFDNKGDFDFMVGVVKNFEYTTRDDGGFDCKTDIVSTGVNMLDSSYSKKQNSIQSQVSDSESFEDRKEKFENALKKNPGSLLNIDTTLTASSYILSLKHIIASTFTSNTENQAYSHGNFYYETNKWIIDFDNIRLVEQLETEKEKKENEAREQAIRHAAAQDPEGYNQQLISYLDAKNKGGTGKVKGGATIGVPTNTWVRWGWFEDNVLSKYLGLVSDTTEINKIRNSFRSVETVLDNEGKPKLAEYRTPGKGHLDSIQHVVYESTKIRNHKYLETININNYILPGSFKPLDISTSTYEFKDSPKMFKLGTIVRNFKKFDVEGEEDKHGYLRNMLVNLNVIEEAFKFSENLTITVAMQHIFDALNQDLNFWEFKLTTDENEPDRVKIIDNQMTNYDFEKNPEPSQMKSKYNIDTGEINLFSRDAGGIFYFPVWQGNSIVKKQNITAKLPTSMQLAAMYGSSLDKMKSLNSGGGSNLNSTGIGMGAIGNNSTNNKDIYNSHIDFAYLKNPAIGEVTGEEKNPITLDGGENFSNLNISFTKVVNGLASAPQLFTISQFVNRQAEKSIEDAVISEEEVANAVKGIQDEDNDFKLDILATAGATLGVKVTDQTLLFLLDTDKFDEKQLEAFLKYATKTFLDKIHGKFQLDGKMKPYFINTIEYLTSVHGTAKSGNTPVLIPLELELSIDGIGGIYPGNSFHSEYVPNRYKNEALFQCFNVNHTIDGSGWTVNISGKMRATLAGLYGKIKTLEDKEDDIFNKWLLALEQDTIPKLSPDANNNDKNGSKRVIASAELNKYLKAGQPDFVKDG